MPCNFGKQIAALGRIFRADDFYPENLSPFIPTTRIAELMFFPTAAIELTFNGCGIPHRSESQVDAPPMRGAAVSSRDSYG
jgi:hypothetical protein